MDVKFENKLHCKTGSAIPEIVIWTLQFYCSQDPQNLVMVTKELKEAQKARMGESKFLNQIKSFNYCLLKHVESVEKTGISLESKLYILLEHLFW